MEQHLWRRLRAAQNPDHQFEFAQRLAGLGTARAFDRLAMLATDQDALGEAVRAVLRQGGEAAEKAVVRAFERDRQSVDLICALPPEPSAGTVDLLAELVSGARDEFFVRYASEVVFRARPSMLPDPPGLLADHPSDLLVAAVWVGAAGAGDSRALQRVRRLLNGDQALTARCLALTMPELAESEKGTACLKHMLDEDDARDRRAALRVVGDLQLEQFAGTALRLYVLESRTTVSVMALGALRRIGRVVRSDFIEVFDELFGRLFSATQGLAMAAQRARDEGRVSHTDYHARRVARVCDRVLKLWTTLIWPEVDPAEAFVSSLTACARVAAELASTVRHADADDHVLRAYGHLTELLGIVVRNLWNLGFADVVPWVLKLNGSVPAEAVRACTPGTDGTPSVDAALDQVRALATEDARLRVEDLRADHPEDEALLRRGLRSALVVRRGEAIASLIAATRNDPTPMASALEASREREEDARATVVEAVGEPTAWVLQRRTNDAPAEWLDRQTGRLRVLVERAGLAATDPRQRETVLAEAKEADRRAWAPVWAEQILQADLLLALHAGGHEQCASDVATGLLSPNASVQAAAEDCLAEWGEAARGPLYQVLVDCDIPLIRARALEVLRCRGEAHPATARSLLGTDDDLLMAVVAKVLGENGQPEDTALLRERWGKSGELADLMIIDALAALDPDGQADFLGQLLGSPWPSIRVAAGRALRRCSVGVRQPVLETARQSEIVWAREAARAVETMSDPGEPEPTFDGGLRPVAGEWALGLRMVQRSHRPWQWGVRFLSEARPGNAAKYAGLFARDGELASAWDAWTLQGAAPYRLVLRLRELASSATDDEAEAWLDLWTELFASQTHGGALLHLKYHGLDPPPDLEVRLHTITQAILQHLSPEFLDRLAPVNPSPASPFGDAACDPDRALMFAYAWDEVLKIELWRRLGHTPLKLPPEAEPGRRARAIEAEWAHLRPFTDELYGFRVKPRLSVDDLIYYCRHGWSQLATHEMVAYLAARATALPCLPKTRKGTRRALERAFLPLLKRGTQQLAKAEGRKQPSPDDLRTVSTSMVEALREFDLWHATPSVFLPFGTAAMTAWDRRAQRGRLPTGGAIAEGYIPFTEYIETLLRDQIGRAVVGPGHGASRGKKDTSEDPQERMPRHVIPEAVIAEAAWSRSSASAALSEEQQAELSDSPSLAQELDDAVLNDLAEAQGRASERASATKPSEVTITLAGQEVICRTIMPLLPRNLLSLT